MKLVKDPTTGIYSVRFKGADGKSHLRTTKTTSKGDAMRCFRMRRPRGKDSLAWQWAFDDVVAERCPSVVRYMVMHAAERLAAELEAKMGGGRG